MKCRLRCPECRKVCRADHKGVEAWNGLQEVGMVPLPPAIHAHISGWKHGERMFVHAWPGRGDIRGRFDLRGRPMPTEEPAKRPLLLKP